VDYTVPSCSAPFQINTINSKYDGGSNQKEIYLIEGMHIRTSTRIGKKQYQSPTTPA